MTSQNKNHILSKFAARSLKSIKEKNSSRNDKNLIMVGNSDFRGREYLVDSSLAEEAVECRRNGYVLTGKFLGQGAYAKVYLGQAIPDKLKNNFKLQKFALNGSKDVKIQLFDVFASQKRVYLVLEYAECGDLLTYVNQCYAHKSKNCLSEDNARMMFRDILAGVHFIHSRGVAHRDLKCENVLLAKNNQAKLSDFGFAVQPRANRDLLKTHCGSYAYAPPEILKQQKYDGKIADLWSLGVILFAMVSGGLPFKESNAKAVLGAMKKPVYFKGYLTNDCKDLIRRLLRIKPQKRITLREVFSHPWIRKNPHIKLSDEQAFGDARPRDTSPPNYLLDSGQKDLRIDGAFDNPDNVLKYIRERMENIGHLRKHKSKKLEETNSKPTKPNILENILNIDLPPEINSKPAEISLSIPRPKGSLPKPHSSLIQARKSIYNTLNNTGPTGTIKQAVRPIELDKEEIIVCPNSAKTTLPSVNDFTKPNGKFQQSNNIKSPLKLIYERKNLLGEVIQEGDSRKISPKPKQKLFKRIDKPGGERSMTSPKVININIDQADAKRSSVNNFKDFKKLDQNMIKKDHTVKFSQRAGAMSVPLKNFIQAQCLLESDPVSPLNVNNAGSNAANTCYPESKVLYLDCQTAKYNMTCTHGFKKNVPNKNLFAKPQCHTKLKPHSPTKKDLTYSGDIRLKTKLHLSKKPTLEKSPSPPKLRKNAHAITSTSPQAPHFTNVGGRMHFHQPRQLYESKQSSTAAQLAWVEKQNAPASTRTVNFADFPQKQEPSPPVKSPTKGIRYSEHYDAVQRSKGVSSRANKAVSPVQGKLLARRSQTVKNILQSLEKQRKLQNSTWFNHVTSPVVQPCGDIDLVNNRHNIVLRMCNDR